MTTEAADLILDTYNALGKVHEETEERNKELVRSLGRSMVRAIKTAAVYQTHRDFDFIMESATEERWSQFRETVKENSQALFNHGDGKPENDIILSTTLTHEGVVSDCVILLSRSSEGIACSLFSRNRGSDAINTFPIALIKTDQLGFKFLGWAMAPTLDKEEVKLPGHLLKGACCYLDDQLEIARKTGAYGDGVVYQAILHPDLLMGLSWAQVS